jgi:hypothetical protein
VRYPAYGIYSALGFTAHNDYVKSFVELGVPGLVLWVLTLLALPVTAWRARRIVRVGGIPSAAIGISVALILVSASDNLQGYTAVLTYVFVLCGALAGLTAAERRRVSELPAAVVDAAPVEAEPQPELEVESLVAEDELPEPEPEPEPPLGPPLLRRPRAAALAERFRGFRRRRAGGGSR